VKVNYSTTARILSRTPAERTPPFTTSGVFKNKKLLQRKVLLKELETVPEIG
jgi:hypothetical protein